MSSSLTTEVFPALTGIPSVLVAVFPASTGVSSFLTGICDALTGVLQATKPSSSRNVSAEMSVVS